MRIIVNGAPREIASVDLHAALDELGYGGARVATALDGSFVPARARPEALLREGCAVEILAPMQGG